MIYENILLYFTGKISNNLSYLNNIFKKVMEENNDYIYYKINDKTKYRLDLISKEVYGTNRYYMFIIWANNFKSLRDLESMKIIKIPTIDFINSFYEKIRNENGIIQKF